MIFQIEDIPFLKKSLHLTLRNSENKASPLKIPQNCAICLGNCKVKNQDPWKFLTPEIFSCSFFQNPWKFHVLNPPCLDF